MEAGRFTRQQGAGQQDFAVEYSVVPRPDGLGAFVSFRDISARQANEERVQRLRLRLGLSARVTDEVGVGVSVGMAAYANDVMSVRKLVTQADQALYEAKKQNERRWKMFVG